MVSISIDPDEEEAIFIENIRGKNVKDSDGTGIGMYIAKKALKFMKANIYARNNGHLCEIEGIKYSRNVFTIEFSK
jgi:signal transduction histidine kinase